MICWVYNILSFLDWWSSSRLSLVFSARYRLQRRPICDSYALSSSWTVSDRNVLLETRRSNIGRSSPRFNLIIQSVIRKPARTVIQPSLSWIPIIFPILPWKNTRTKKRAAIPQIRSCHHCPSDFLTLLSEWLSCAFPETKPNSF